MATQPQSSPRRIYPLGMAHPYLTAFPKLPALPILLRIHGFIMQNKPNPGAPGTNATSVAAKSYEQKPPRPPQKNKPNQTQTCRAVAPSQVEAKPRSRPIGAGFSRPQIINCQSSIINITDPPSAESIPTPQPPLCVHRYE